MYTEPLQYGLYYHIFNRGINGCDLFLNDLHTKYFFDLYAIYIAPIADTYAWCLMKNHFHLLVRIKNIEEIGYLNPMNANNEDNVIKWQVGFPENELQSSELNGWKKPKPSSMFAHLFDAYAKKFNFEMQRTGSLFETPFRRINIESENYFRNLVVYIHRNPINHGIVNNIEACKNTSYHSLISDSPTKLMRNELIEWFGNKTNFIDLHRKEMDNTGIEKYLIDED